MKKRILSLMILSSLLMSCNEPKEDIGMKCFNPYKCEFWEYCTRNLPKPNVFDT